MKKVLIALLFSSIGLVANIQKSDIINIHKNFLKLLHSNNKIASTEEVKIDNISIGYISKLQNDGYILSPNNKQKTPIKAYSLETNFSSLPLAYQKFLYTTLDTKVSLNRSLSTNKNYKRWEYLESSRILNKAYTQGTYLLSTTWDQNTPYSTYLPKKNNESVLTGCVQTAISQVMKYHNYPQKAHGVYVHDWAKDNKTKALKTILNRTYNWKYMPNKLDSNAKQYQIDEVAMLMRDLAIVNETKFGTSSEGGSGATANISALIDNFSYSTNMARLTSNNNDFFKILKEQIDSKNPVLFSFPGHMTVADGYESDASGDKIHINMGWSGAGNDFYYLDDNIATVVNDNLKLPKGTFEMIYNIKPCLSSNNDCSENIESTDKIDGLNINGKFDFPYDTDQYKIFLKNNTTLGGSRGYSNQAFFISIYDLNHNLLYSSQDSGSIDLNAGEYILKTSLCNSGSCWQYDESYTNYTINIDTSVLSIQEKDILKSNINDREAIIINKLDDLIINSDTKKLIYAVDEDDDDIKLNIISTRGDIDIEFEDNLLLLKPDTSKENGYSKIKLFVSSNNKTVEKEFNVLYMKDKLSFDKSMQINSTFSSQASFQKHKVALDGECTISGHNYGNFQAFFNSVLDESASEIISMTKDKITHTFDKGLYYIGASLKQNPFSYSGKYYPLIEGKTDKYTIDISCPNMDDSFANKVKTIGFDIDNIDRSLVLKKGWNLVSIPVDTSITNLSMFGSYKYMYIYKNNKWLDQDHITSLEKGIGVWIYQSNESTTVDFVGDDYTNNLSTLSSGWHLIGAGKDIYNLSSVLDDNIYISWKYSNNNWSLFSYDDEIIQSAKKMNFGVFENIKAGEGFWVYK
jgi:hypothetical protein